jgi:membrane fusion protein, multidrug efflux system
MNKKTALILAALALGGAAYGAYTFKDTKAAGGAKPAMAVSVEAGKVTVGKIERTIEAVGTLASNESVVLSPEISGRITEILFEEGQAVTVGAPLFKLDDAVSRAELAQVEASLTLSRTNYDRAKSLYQKSAGSALVLDEALAKRNADQAGADLARARLSKTVISAPFDGVVGLRSVSVGDIVNPGQALANLEDLDPLKVDFRVPELYLSAVKPGQAIRVTVDAFPGREFEGSVTAIDPLVDSGGRAVVLRAALPNADGVLRPGLFARVGLLVGSTENAVLVPEEALVPQGKAPFVYVVRDGKAVAAPVKTGLRRKGQVEITEGLGADDVVVTAGQMKLRPNTPVTVQPPAGAAK